jgi:hypothetical protein
MKVASLSRSRPLAVLYRSAMIPKHDSLGKALTRHTLNNYPGPDEGSDPLDTFLSINRTTNY